MNPPRSATLVEPTSLCTPLMADITRDGATYPVRCTYDTAGRRTSLTTFRTTLFAGHGL